MIFAAERLAIYVRVRPPLTDYCSFENHFAAAEFEREKSGLND